MKYLDKKKVEIDDYFPYIKCLIVTATPTETKALHDSLIPIEGVKLIRTFHENQTYFIGKLGKYLVCHVQCEMGSISNSSSIITVSSAIDFLNPNAVIMVGIAFGVDEERQRIGDVLISEVVVSYNIKKVSEIAIIQRGPIPPSGNVLLNRFKHGSSDWEYQLADGKAKTIFGQMLSGETLVDNLAYRDALLKAYPEAIGGEMEGAGLFAAAISRKVEWIVIKGICDYADGNKDRNKKEFQKIAAYSAVSLCKHICSINNVFESLQFEEYITKNESTSIKAQSSDINNILYDVYTPEREEFYYVREIDEIFSSYLISYSVWITGESGCGKTTLILRNLFKSGRNFSLINLAHCVDYQAFELFFEIYSKLKDILDPDAPLKSFDKISHLIEEISKLVGHRKDKEPFCIFIEEIPFPVKDESLKTFLMNLNALLIHNRANFPGIDFRVLLSSIESPLQFLNKAQIKIKENLKFILEKNWDNESIRGLLILLVENLGLNYTEKQKQDIITASKGSPRFLKNFIRDYISFNCKNEKEFTQLLTTVGLDLNLHE